MTATAAANAAFSLAPLANAHRTASSPSLRKSAPVMNTSAPPPMCAMSGTSA